jgi:hypothetical protein
LLQYLAGIALLGHGLGHTMGPLASYGVEIKGMSDKPSWLLGGNRTMKGKVGKAWSAIWIAAIVPFVISSAGAFMGEPWWREWAIIGSLISIAAILPWWNSVMIGVKAGFVLDIAILLVLLTSWGEDIIGFFELP